MSSPEPYRATLLTNLRNEVWGNQEIFKSQRDLTDPGTGKTRTVDYLDFGDHFEAIKVLSSTVRDGRFFIREEYRQAIETFEKGGEYAGGACIMGQPGIGKSCFIAYAVIERLRKKESVAVQILPENYSESYALFSEEGVHLYPGDAQGPLRSHKGIWAISDSNADVNIPAIAFRKTPDVVVFQTTSPKISRWKEWTKQNSVRPYIMSVWSSEEIAALAYISGDDDNVKRMSELASRWGPIPRTLLQISGDDQRDFEPRMRSTALEAMRNCRSILRSMGSLDAPVDPGPSSIFFIRPRKAGGTVSRVLHTVYVPTQKIAEILGAAVCAAAEEDRQNFFNAMITSSGTRAAAGFIFEIWIHSFLASGNALQCEWHGRPNRSLPSTIHSAGQTTQSNEELRSTAPPFYWRAPPGFPGIDGALFVEKDVYAIQITISSTHKSPQPGLDKLRQLLGQEETKKLRWRVLFVGNQVEQSEAVSKAYADELSVDMGGDGIKQKFKKSKAVPVPVGWCATSPVNAEISVVTTLTNYTPLESDDE